MNGRILIAFFVMLCAVGPVPAQQPAFTGKELTQALQPFVEKHELAGAVVLVANKQAILTTQTVGYADVEKKIPLKSDSVFWIASQSKSITATALMILVDEGKVKLDDPVSKYLPEFQQIWVLAESDKDHLLLRHPKRPITVRDVLSHVSGLPFRSAAEEPTLDGISLEAACRTYAMTPLAGEPGTKYQYSNAGINIGGRIIEVVSKMPYEDFLLQRLFEPLGMTDTTFWPNEEQTKRIAHSYKPGKGGVDLEKTTISQLRYPLKERAHRYPMPAGGLFSTATDVAKFCQMVLNQGEFNGKRLLSEKAVLEMTSRQTPKEMKENYGLGWSVGNGSAGHGGAMSTNMHIDTKNGIIYVFMVQHAGFPGEGRKSSDAFRKAADAVLKSK